MNTIIEYHMGLPTHLRHQAALLYDQAFGAKMARAIPQRADRLILFEQSFCAPYAFVALHQGQLIGLAGFQTKSGSLTSGLTRERLQTHLGWLGGRWADGILSWYERECGAHELIIDGIAVREDWRGAGIGSMLLEQVQHYAQECGLHSVRLNVVDTNHAARRLYERLGFVATETESAGHWRWLLGFGAAVTMVLTLLELERL